MKQNYSTKGIQNKHQSFRIMFLDSVFSVNCAHLRKCNENVNIQKTNSKDVHFKIVFIQNEQNITIFYVIAEKSGKMGKNAS